MSTQSRQTVDEPLRVAAQVLKSHLAQCQQPLELPADSHIENALLAAIKVFQSHGLSRSKMTEHFTREAAVARAMTKCGELHGDLLHMNPHQLHAFAEDCVTAKQKEWEAQGAACVVQGGTSKVDGNISQLIKVIEPIPAGTKLYTNALPAQPVKTFVQERAQLEQEWCELRKMQQQCKQAVDPVNAELVEAEAIMRDLYNANERWGLTVKRKTAVDRFRQFQVKNYNLLNSDVATIDHALPAPVVGAPDDLRQVVERINDWSGQGGACGYLGGGKWSFVSTSIALSPDELNYLFKLTGIEPKQIVSKGSCASCVHSINGRECGYKSPCIDCARPIMSNFQLASTQPQQGEAANPPQVEPAPSTFNSCDFDGSETVLNTPDQP